MNPGRMKLHFLIFFIIIILWSVSLYFYNNPVLLSGQEWLKITVSLTIIAIFELFCFIIVISNISLKKFKIPLIISSVLGIVVILTLFVNDALMIKSYLMAFPPHSAIFLLLLFIYGGLAAAILFEKSLKTSVTRAAVKGEEVDLSSSPVSHLRAVYILVGFGMFIIAATVLYVFLPLISGQKEYFWLGPVFALLFLLSSIIGYYLTKEFQKRKEVESLVEEWEKLAQAKDQFLLSLQHHLRTPLIPIKGYLEKILDGTYGREENPVIKEKLTEMKKSADTLYSLMESLLDIQELRTGKKALNLEDCQIGNLINGIIEELKPQAEQKGLYLKYEPPTNSGGGLPAVKLDKKRIRETVWNLVDNAIKYTIRGGVIIISKTEDKKLKIAVSDTGIGMEKEEIDYFLQGKLFERGREAQKLYGPGRGIGLSIVVEFIKAHDGKIWAESKGQGKGTTFWVELPI